MTDRGPPTHQSPIVVPHVVPLVPTVQPPVTPAQPAVPSVQPNVPPAQPGIMPQLNWSHFKPELIGKPDEDAEAHFIRTNDWMDTHVFSEDCKVQKICLTLEGEDRLWYQSLRPIPLDWNG